MKLFTTIVGGLITLFGVSIMLTPLRTYFLIGWIVGVVLLCNGLSMLFTGLRYKIKSKKFVGITTTLIGIVLLVTDLQQILTQIFIVYLVAGGIMLVGFVECIIGYMLVKKGQGGMYTLVVGAISFAVGLFGLIFKEATVIVIGLIVGYHIVRIGLNVISFSKYMGAQVILDADELPFD